MPRSTDSAPVGWVAAVLVALCATTACSGPSSVPGAGTVSTTQPRATATVPAPVPGSSSVSTPQPAESTPSSVPSAQTATATQSAKPKPAVQVVHEGKLTGFRVVQVSGRVLVDAKAASALELKRSPRCEDQRHPCYDPPDGLVAPPNVGSLPSSRSACTTYVMGHSNLFHPDDSSVGIFTNLLEVRVGDTFVATTTKGVLTYRVDKTFRVSFNQALGDSEAGLCVPNRLIAVTCYFESGDPWYRDNFVVVSHLVAAKPHKQ